MKDESLKIQVKNGLAILSRGRKFYSRSEAGELESELWELRDLIGKLVKEDLTLAIKSIHRFLELHKKIFERIDDSDGTIAPIFHQLVEDLAPMYQRLPPKDHTALPDVVFSMVVNNPYSIYDYVISDFASVLGKPGLMRLEEKIRSTLDALPENKKDDFDFSRYLYIDALYNIADASLDVDHYIAIANEFGRHNEHESLEIGKRLVTAKRFGEALRYFQKIDESSNLRSDALPFEIIALEELNEKERAQNLRIQHLLRTLKKEQYEECLKHATNLGRTKKDLLSMIHNHKEDYRALVLLTEIKELSEAAKLVRIKREEWNGRFYYHLHPVARDLEHQYPLESTILYRLLIDDILARANSRYYHHAVAYLKKIEGLSTRIKTWGDMPTHQIYFAEFSKAHEKKPAFWRRYDEWR